MDCRAWSIDFSFSSGLVDAVSLHLHRRWFTYPFDVEALPEQGGAYIIEFDIPRMLPIEVGRLGVVGLGPGKVRYYGSARGGGGLRARISRHLPGSSRCLHWHIDWLTSRQPCRRVAAVVGGRECELLAADLESSAWTVAHRRFGSTDCRQCDSHLLKNVAPLFGDGH